jgi:hypothetical protein
MGCLSWEGYDMVTALLESTLVDRSLDMRTNVQQVAATSGS